MFAERLFRDRTDGPLLGVAWPREWLGRCSTKLSLRSLAVHLTFVPAVLGAATLLGLDLPGAAWILAFGPLPVSIVAFARLYGYSTRTAATGLALSFAAPAGRRCARSAAARVASARSCVPPAAAKVRPTRPSGAAERHADPSFAEPYEFLRLCGRFGQQ